MATSRATGEIINKPVKRAALLEHFANRVDRHVNLRWLPALGAATDRNSHQVKLMPATKFVKAFNTGNKADTADARAILRLLAQCARSYIQRLDKQTGRLAEWVRTLLTPRHSSVAACALANKLARNAWVLATRLLYLSRACPPCRRDPMAAPTYCFTKVYQLVL